MEGQTGEQKSGEEETEGSSCLKGCFKCPAILQTGQNRLSV